MGEHMKQNKKAEQQLIVALNRLQGINFTDVMDKIPVGSISAVTFEPDRERYFSFNLASYSFAVNASHFCEVFVAPAIAPLPNAPEILLGLCNVRGILVPVYQLHGLLHQNIPAHRTIFCIGKGEHAVGILTDNLPSSVSLPRIKGVKAGEEKMTDSLPGFIRELVVAEVSENNKNYLLLDGARVAEQLLMLSLKQPTPASTSKGSSAPAFH
jgi:chemotaxis signal transduction protein